MINQFIRQDLNTDYQSARAPPRVRDSAANSTRVKGRAGVMADCLTGYPGTPVSNGGQAGFGAGGGGGGRAVKPEAGDNANRGKGTLQKVVCYVL